MPAPKPAPVARTPAWRKMGSRIWCNAFAAISIAPISRRDGCDGLTPHRLQHRILRAACKLVRKPAASAARNVAATPKCMSIAASLCGSLRDCESACREACHRSTDQKAATLPQAEPSSRSGGILLIDNRFATVIRSAIR